MFKSSLHMVVSFGLFMAILGQSQASFVVSGEADSGESPAASDCHLDVGATHLPSLRTASPEECRRQYVVARYTPADEEDASVDGLPPAVASEITSIDADRRAIVAGGPINLWQFDRVRARYEALMKKGSGEPAVEDALRLRLARLGQLEQAAKSAATIEAILAQSHRRDRDVVVLKRRLQTTNARRSRAYEATGYMQPSAQKVEGEKLFVLIGKNGGTVAFLRIPPGLDPDPMLARKVGVRGVARFDEDLQSRLITVRTLEPIESRR